MKKIKLSLLVSVCFVALLSAFTLNSCTHDSCTILQCQNGGSCSEGFCQCPAGFEGSECEIQSASRVVGSYIGDLSCADGSIYKDRKIDVVLVEEPNIVRMRIAMGTLNINLKGEARTPEILFDPYFSSTGNYNLGYGRYNGPFLNIYIEAYMAPTASTQETRSVCEYRAVRVDEQ